MENTHFKNIIVLDDMHGHQPTQLAGLQPLVAQHVPLLVVFWWWVWVTVAVVLTLRFVLLPVIKRQKNHHRG